jgi:hypothetical protein
MKIPPSEKELNSVHEKIQELKTALCNAANLSEDLIEFLNDNFLALDDECKKNLTIESVKIGSAMWQINVQQYKMQEHRERIVSAKPEGQGVDECARDPYK